MNFQFLLGPLLILLGLLVTWWGRYDYKMEHRHEKVAPLKPGQIWVFENTGPFESTPCEVLEVRDGYVRYRALPGPDENPDTSYRPRAEPIESFKRFRILHSSPDGPQNLENNIITIWGDEKRNGLV